MIGPAMLKLRPFQREDVEFLKQNDLRVLVASAPGTGKTATSITAVVEARTALPALVVCPASVAENWIREIRMWAPGHRIVQISDTKTRIPRLDGNTFIVTSWSLLDARWSTLVHMNIKTVIADEAHFSRNSDTLRAQALLQITERAKHVILLTGTPIVNESSELATLKSILGTDNPPTIRRLLEDVAPDIPPKTRSYLDIDLPADDRAEYDRAREDFESWFLNEWSKLSKAGETDLDIERTLTAEALTKIGYLRRLVGAAKIPAAVAWIDRAVRLGEPVVVFAEHQTVIKGISKALRRRHILHVILDGNASAAQRQSAIDGFQKHQVPVFLGSKAAKEGITLTAARHLLFVERFFTAADEEQAEDRIRRIGQKFATTIWFLHAADTIDDRVDEIVRAKRRIVREAIGSADIEETAAGNVAAILGAWQTGTSGRRGPPLRLGLDELPPALPLARTVHALLFQGERWKPETAVIWCQMNGYKPRKRMILPDRLKVQIQPADYFRPGQFKTVRIAKDVMAIVGVRHNAENSRRIKQALKRAQ
jgi:SNF2 family DNA or RNA helicase